MDAFDKPIEPWEQEDMRRLRQGLENYPFGGSMRAVNPEEYDMAKATPAKLEYQAAYNKRPDQVKKQTKRRAAERAAVKSGASPIGDGKDVIHKKALDNGGGNTPGNLGVQPPAKNRAWRKNRRNYSVPNTK